jgi:hypothetical protein
VADDSRGKEVCRPLSLARRLISAGLPPPSSYCTPYSLRDDHQWLLAGDSEYEGSKRLNGALPGELRGESGKVGVVGREAQ